MFTRCALSASTSFSSSAHIVPSIIGNYVITHTIYKAKPKSHQFITKISFHNSQNKKQINKKIFAQKNFFLKSIKVVKLIQENASGYLKIINAIMLKCIKKNKIK
mgnify:CR=1 FL=1